MVESVESTETQSSERRRAPRAWVPGLAVLTSGTQPPSVWRVSNLSAGGVGLVGDGRLETGRHALALHVAGFAPLALEVNVLRRQLLTRGGRCGVKFVGVGDAQRRALLEMAAADHTPPPARPRALVVAPDEARGTSLRRELALLGFEVRGETSPGQGGAWLQREETDALFVDESAVEADRWSLLQFVRDTAPEIRRLVIASDVRGFRLYYAIKAGLVDTLVEPTIAAEDLARHLAGAPVAVAARRGRSAR
ncbi:MAG TPA: PilZ domain-containing protein [Polyangia bacterium]|nr:PilZ domain-containing protein [Polyangia bacterium]